MADDETVAGVTDSTRNDAQEGDPRPGRTESRKDFEDRVRLYVDRVDLDQNDAGQLGCAAQVLFDYRSTDRRLLRGEAKNAGWIAPDYESHPGVAQITDPVEQDQWRLCPGYHRVEPLAKLVSAQT
jgi:hypothetical protein